MRWVALVGFALLAACEQSGVQFIVEIPADYGQDGDPQVMLPDEVRLFIGLGDETSATIAPEGFGVTERRTGHYWLRDPSNLGPEVDRAPIGIDSPAVFSYGRGGGVEELGVVIAVGYTRGEPTSSVAEFHARIGANRVFQYRMGLNAAANPRDRTLRSRVNQLEVWGANECVFAENRRLDLEDSSHKVAFIVGSADDRDCDGMLDGDPKECFPEVHLGEGPSTTPTCLYQDAAGSLCTIGVPLCRDTVGTDTSCNATRFCLPPQACEQCGNDADPWQCAQNVATVSTYALKCVLPAIQTAGGLQLCDPSVDIQADIHPPFNAACENVAVKAAADSGFSDTFSLGGPGTTAKVKISHSACTLKIEPSGLVGNVMGSGVFSALMRVALDERRGIAVPVLVEVRALASCVDNGFCTWSDPGSPNNPNDCVESMPP